MKWEYCAVVGVSKPPGYRELDPVYPAIWYFTPTGYTKRDIKGDEAQEVGKAIAALGDDGWEMVGTGDMGSPKVGYQADTALFFKRPKP